MPSDPGSDTPAKPSGSSKPSSEPVALPGTNDRPQRVVVIPPEAVQRAAESGQSLTLTIVAGSIVGYALGIALAAFAIIGPVCGAVGTAQLLEYWFKSQS